MTSSNPSSSSPSSSSSSRRRRRHRRKVVCIAVAGIIINLVLGFMFLPELTSYLFGDTVVHQSKSRELHASAANNAMNVTLSLPSQDQQQQQQQPQKPRPVMHTFFTELKTHRHDNKQKNANVAATSTTTTTTTAGMSEQAHHRMLEVWSQAWWEAGWDPVILTMEDARQHKDFDHYHDIMMTYKMNSYNLACFYRWIAMAAVAGGGWMSDYDVLPLHDFTWQGSSSSLPNQAALTIHDGYHVPSLVSGNASEWNRLLHRMIDYASTKKTTVHLRRSQNAVVTRTPSDMQTLAELRQLEPSIYMAESTVIGGSVLAETVTTPRHWNATIDCETWTSPSSQTARAIHFAHSHLIEGYLKAHPDQSMEDRPEIAKTWWNEWKRTCPPQLWGQPLSITTPLQPQPQLPQPQVPVVSSSTGTMVL